MVVAVRRLVTLAVIAIATLPMPARSASVPVLVVDGRGFGHGVGMAQDGAYWMGAAGARTDQILGHFYPGTTIGKGQGPVRVAVGDVGPTPAAVVLAFPDGGEVRDARSGDQSQGFPISVPKGGAVRVVSENGRYRVEGPTNAVALGRPTLASNTRPQIELPTTSTTEPPPEPTTTTAPPSDTTTTTAPVIVAPPPDSTTTTAPPSDGSGGGGGGAGETTTTQPAQNAPAAATTTRPIWAAPANNGAVDLTYRQRRYRGLLEVTAAAGPLRVINEVDVETYLKGMGEVRDPRWPPAALRAQAIAARTYALRAMLLGGGEICDTQRCQVYLGAQAEYGAMNKAVDDTRSQVLAFGRQLASAVYSANGGGHSASRQEGFGVPEDNSAPYLRPAPYLTQNPLPWNVTIALDTVAARLGYAGTITAVTASRTGPSGRVLEVTLDGTAGPKPVQGIAFDAALGLKSTLFTLRLDTADVAPEAPPAEDLIQAPPEQAAAIVEVPTTEASGPTKRASRSRAVDRIEIDPTSPPSTGDTADEMALTFASWAATAVAGTALLLATGRRQSAQSVSTEAIPTTPGS